MKRWFGVLVVVVVLIALILSQGGRVLPVAGRSIVTAPLLETPPHGQAATANLLVNGNMDNAFYARPPNHYVAGMWYEWFVSKPHQVPEFLDGGSPYHDACYPPQAGCESRGNHSQGYILWSDQPFTAGIYQPVKVTPCLPYEFSAYARNDSVNYVSKVGIDPTGQQLPLLPVDPNDWFPRNNCPPDGHTQCPDPGVSSPAGLPSHIVWSPDFHTPAFGWAEQSVMAEALSDTIMVWTYTAATTEVEAQSAYWDVATLITATTYPGDRLPAPVSWVPTAAVTNVAVVTGDTAITITWGTTAPALTQVWYEVSPAGTLTTSVAYSYTAYFPVMARNYKPYALSTPVDLSRSANHQAVITNLQAGDNVKLVIAARYWTGGCVTEVSAPLEVALPQP